MARPDAPPELGLALSQARAASVRSHLLGLLSASAAWQGEDPSDGLRAGGYDEGDEIEETLEFYSQCWVGEKIRAIGQWGHFKRSGQCASINISGFE